MRYLCYLCWCIVLLGACAPTAETPPSTVVPTTPDTPTDVVEADSTSTVESSETDDNFDRQAMLQNLTDSVIVPAHEEFATRTTDLVQAAQTLSNDPTEANLEAAQQAWQEALIAWQPLMLYEVDNIRLTVARSGINKWPSNTEFIEDFIAERDTIDAEFVGGIGATSRGLPALEYLLFDSAGDNAAVLEALNERPQRMQYVVATAQALNNDAETLLQFWSPDGENYAAEFVARDSSGEVMQSAVSELSNELVNTLETLVQTRLGDPLGRSNGGEAQPELAEAALSGTSLPAIVSTIAAFQQTFTGEEGMGFDDYLVSLDLDTTDQPLAERIVQQSESTITALEAIEAPLHIAVVEQPEQVEAAYEEARSLLVLAKVDMAGTLGVTLTFGDADGD
ncbi:MAG: imelysin family protein [Chloroflexota bacterium]